MTNSIKNHTVEKFGSLSNFEILQIQKLFLTVWPRSTFYSFEYLDWLYRLNPTGKAETLNIWDGKRIVAHYATIPIISDIFGKKEKGLLSLNSVVHPDFQGRGYFRTLAAKTYEEAKLRNASFVIGVANARSTLLFQRQLKFQKVCPLSVKLGLGSINRKKENFESACFSMRWEESNLKWRLKRPGAKYRVTSNSNGTWLWGYTNTYRIWAEIGWFSNDELQFKRSFSQLKPLPIITLNPVKLWIGLDQNCIWNHYNYIDLPDRYKPSPLNLIFKDLTNLGRLLTPETVRLSLLDFDAY